MSENSVEDRESLRWELSKDALDAVEAATERAISGLRTEHSAATADELRVLNMLILLQVALMPVRPFTFGLDRAIWSCENLRSQITTDRIANADMIINRLEELKDERS